MISGVAMKGIVKYFYLIILTCLSVSGRQARGENLAQTLNARSSTPTSPPTRTQTPTTVVITPDKKIDLTLTPTSSLVHPTRTKTPTLESTSTPLPIISTDTAKEILTRFMQDNGGCQLPCVLGLIPGTSSRSAVDSFMEYFQLHSHNSDEQMDNLEVDSYQKKGQGGIDLLFWKNRIRIQFVLDYLLVEDKVSRIIFGVEAFQHSGQGANEIAHQLYDHPYYYELASAFTLPQILQTYGAPSQILIRPLPTDPEFPQNTQYPFDFILYYPEQGFLVEYIAIRTDTSSSYSGCPTKSIIEISAWDPKETVSLEDAMGGFSRTGSVNPSNLSNFKPIQDVTTYTVQSFYETFRDPRIQKCIQTSKKLWPKD
jgi:hypothetical protein